MPHGLPSAEPNYGLYQYVYVIGPRAGPRKIGISGNPRTRAQQLQAQYKVRMLVHYAHPRGAFMAPDVERLAHQILEDDRIELEWFDVTTERAIEAIKLAEEAYHRGERAQPRTISRDPEEMPRRVGVGLTPQILRAVDDWRAAQAKIPSRSDALSQLIEIGLAAGGFKSRGPRADVPASPPPEAP